MKNHKNKGFSAIALILFLVLTIFTFFLFNSMNTGLDPNFRNGLLAVSVGFCAFFVVLSFKTGGV